MSDKTASGLRIKEIRERRGLSQQELGARLNINPNNISNWELGYSFPTYSGIRKLCMALACSADELLGLKDLDLNADEQQCLDIYRRLDEPGRDVVRAVLDSQLRRLGEK